MKRVAFLKILPHEGIIPNIEKIHNWLLRDAKKYNFKIFTEIRPFDEYTASNIHEKNIQNEHRLVAWRFDRDDKVSDEEVVNLVGPDGNILYAWVCPRCKSFCRRAEHPNNSKDDVYFGCRCRESVFYGCFEL
ncbi:MAG: hypothetical protein WCI36_05340 [bacterium]